MKLGSEEQFHKSKKNIIQPDIAPDVEGQPTQINTVVVEDFDLELTRGRR